MRKMLYLSTILLMLSCTKKHQFDNPEGSQISNTFSKDWISFLARRVFNSRKNYFDSLNQYHITKEEAIKGLKNCELDSNGYITWIGHATFLIKMNKLHILTDPFFSNVAGSFGLGPKRYIPLTINVDDIPKIDLIICTHNHYDHLDIQSLKKIKKSFGNQIQIFCPIGLAKYFYNIGFTQVTELSWYEKSHYQDIDIFCLPAIHNSGRGLFDKNQTLWCSFGLKSNSFTFYFSGDTSYDPYLFKKMHKVLGDCNLCIIGIGGYAPEKLLGKSHTNPEEAIKVAIDFHAQNIIGMHWGTLNLSDEPVNEPIERFYKSACLNGFKSEAIWLMKLGETRQIIHCPLKKQ